MVEFVELGPCTLYHGDCLEIMPLIDRADMVATDPPYLLESGGNTDDGMSGKFAQANYNNRGSIVETPITWPQFMLPIYRAMTDGHAYFMCNNRHVWPCIQQGHNAGFGFHNILAWHKRAATANRWYMKNLEFIVFLYKGKARAINNCGSQQLIEAPIVRHTPHPTEKPASVMQILIENSSQPGQTVLDPFMGSGSTGVAALRSGRRFVGIELQREHFDLACERIDAALMAPDMFAAAGS